MSDSDNTKEIPARQVTAPQPNAWRIVEDDDGTGDFLVLDGDGMIVAIGVPIHGDSPDGADTRARALCIAKAPEMHRLLTQAIDGAVDWRVWMAEMKSLLERAE